MATKKAINLLNCANCTLAKARQGGAQSCDPLWSRVDYVFRLRRMEPASGATDSFGHPFIGRKRIRRDLLQWLRKVRRGAILVTGARGAGKTTFVNHCLGEYSRDLGNRHRRSRVNRVTVPLVFFFRLVVIPCALGALGAVVFTSLRDSSRWLSLPLFFLALAPALFLVEQMSQPISADISVRKPKHRLAFALAAAIPVTIDVILFEHKLLWGLTWCPLAMVTMLMAVEFIRGRGDWFPAYFERVVRDYCPVARVTVNLGYDDLDPIHVYRSMLDSLANLHNARVFMPFRYAERFFMSALLTNLTLQLGDSVRSHLPAKLRWDGHRGLLTNLVPPHPPSYTEALLAYLLPARHSQLTVSVLDIAAFALVFTAMTVLSGRLRRDVSKVLRRIDASHKSTHASMALEAAVPLPLSKIALNSPNATLEAPKLDPRAAELMLVQILEHMAYPHAQLGPLAKLFPGAEVIFVFDELDKVGTQRRFLDSVVSTRDSRLYASSYFSSERNRELHRLLSDMKNLLSTAPARFVFIGGRDLDDDWLADRTSRSPLLSTIFDNAVYVRSLLTDHDEDCFIAENTKRARDSSCGATPAGEKGDRLLHGTSSWLQSRTSEIVRAYGCSASVMGGPPELRCACEEGVDIAHKPERFAIEHLDEFWELWIRDLAVASRGNLKRLEELLSNHEIQPTPKARGLRFDYRSRYLVALNNEIFDRVARLVANRREDKVIQSIFYLAEFLFKFHKRAFNWSSLELLEEIVDVHHAPDVRDLLSDIVQSLSQSYLVPIMFGMYKFRFDSAFAAEIRYASRISDFASAAFNFTLDETYMLKQEYERRLNASADHKEQEFAAQVALGELFDFEEDYERARFHYAAAIRTLDEKLEQEHSGAVRMMLAPKESQGELIGRAQIDWSIPRIFNKLRIGITLEKSRDYVDAMLHYRNARTIADAMLHCLLADVAKGYDAALEATAIDSSDGKQQPDANSKTKEGRTRWLETVKMTQLLFQPLFACAWAAEKSRAPSEGGEMIDYLLGTIERRLQRVTEAVRRANESRQATPVPDFSVTMADLHYNAGSFFVVKGVNFQRRAIERFESALRSIGYGAGEQANRQHDLRATPWKLNSRSASILLALAAAHLASASSESHGLDEYVKHTKQAIEVLEKSGHHEQACREHIWFCDIIACLNWERHLLKAMECNCPCPPVASGQPTCPTALLEYKALKDDEETYRFLLDMAMGHSEPSAKNILRELGQRPYTTLGTLDRLRGYIRYKLLNNSKATDWSELDECVEALRRLYAAYDSPVHFTYHSYGTTLALWCKQVSLLPKHRPSLDFNTVKNEALTALRKSLEVVTGKGAYAELISTIYFLEDGFNDRSLHLAQAFQTFAYNHTHAIIERLKELREPGAAEQ